MNVSHLLYLASFERAAEIPSSVGVNWLLAREEHTRGVELRRVSQLETLVSEGLGVQILVGVRKNTTRCRAMICLKM